MNLPEKGTNLNLLALFNQSTTGPFAQCGVRSCIDAGRVCVLNRTSGTTVAANVSVANTPRNRRRGLLGRPPLSPDQGMWIVPCESVHTVGMRYPIDIVYLDRKRKVVKIVEALAPYRVSVCLRARSVIELASGTVRLSRTQVGHQLQFAAASGEPMSEPSN